MAETPTVLVITPDEEEFRELAAAWRAQEFPVRVHWAHGVGDAVAYLCGADGYDDRRFFPLPDALLLAVATRLDGALETIVWSRSHAEFEKLPLLVLAPVVTAADAERALGAGATACYVRPLVAERTRALFAGVLAHLRKGPIGRHAPWPGAVDAPVATFAA
jgi:DNA-binding response OmpR family regulator